jgi:hypothetical protein
VNRSNFQRRKIETFTEHVNTDNPIQFAPLELGHDRFDVCQAVLATDEREPQARVRIIYPLEVFGSVYGISPDHNQMLKTGISITDELLLCGTGDSNIGRNTGSRPNFLKSDVAKNPIMIGPPQIIVKDKPSPNFFVVTSERCGGKQHLSSLS